MYSPVENSLAWTTHRRYEVEGASVPGSLDPGESKLVVRLTQAGLSRGAATLAVVMATRAHARPEKELIDIVLQYPALETRATAEAALRELRSMGWVVDSVSNELALTHQASDLRHQIGSRLGDESAADTLTALRANLEPFVTVVGPMHDERVYSSYLDLLQAAQTEICLLMLATSPRLTSVDILRERAEAGVQVRVLVGSPQVVATLREETMRPIAEQFINEWSRNLAGLPCAELRVSDSVEDMWLASCMAIDRRIVRLDIYDPHVQRSLQGVMVELESPQGLNFNVVRVFTHLFNQAWDRARPLSGPRRILWLWRRAWKIWAGLLLAALALIPVPLNGWFELLIGIASGLLAAALAEFRGIRHTSRRRRL
jgi:hypothetical protein